MAIKIIKKRHVVEARAPAALVVDPQPTFSRTAAEALKDWKENHPATNARAKECEFCKHFYIMPCDEARKDVCANYLHLQKKAAADVQV